MSRRGGNNGALAYTCPFCGKIKGYCNLQGRINDEDIPLDFSHLPRYQINSHTIKCFKAKEELQKATEQ